MFFKNGRYLIKFEKVPTIVFLCMLPLLISLGFWQLHRADEKRAYLSLLEQRMNTDSLLVSSATPDNSEELKYRKVKIEGRYDIAHQFLIDNQISNGKAGYFVLTPFMLKGENKAVLINRGWLPVNQNRNILPDVSFNSKQTDISGRINSFPSVGIKLPGAEKPTDSWPSVVQLVDSKQIAHKLGFPLFSFQIELDKDFPNGFKRQWHTTIPMPPEKHTAYAVQWFALAFTLTVLFFAYSLKKRN